MKTAAGRSAAGWTAEEIRARLGMSAAIYQKVRLGAREIAAIRENGIQRIELLAKHESFDFENRFQVAEVLAECKRQGITVVSIHGNLKLDYRTEDAGTRRGVMRETLNTIEFAEEIGAGIFVAHFGFGENAGRIVTELLKGTRDLNIVLTTETMGGDFTRYLPVIDEIGSDRFGLTVDIGHPRDADGVNPFVKKGRAREALVQCGGRVRHLHLHETFDLETKPDHRPPLHADGIIAWKDVFAGLKDIGYGGELLFEDGRGENPEEWSRMAGAFPEAFVQRCAGR